MKKLFWGMMLAAIGASLLVATRNFAQPSQKGRSVHVSGSIAAHLDFTYEGVGAWVGCAWVSFDGQPAKLATLVDRHNWGVPKHNGGGYGSETITLTFVDGSGSFDMPVNYHDNPSASPNFFTVEENGTIGNGKGDYAQVSGTVTTRGTVVFAPPPFNLPWIASIEGQIQGLP